MPTVLEEALGTRSPRAAIDTSTADGGTMSLPSSEKDGTRPSSSSPAGGVSAEVLPANTTVAPEFATWMSSEPPVIAMLENVNVAASANAIVFAPDATATDGSVRAALPSIARFAPFAKLMLDTLASEDDAGMTMSPDRRKAIGPESVGAKIRGAIVPSRESVFEPSGTVTAEAKVNG